jgi:dipeptidyl aminopeptidase/acylaminoacyl peptidase
MAIRTRILLAVPVILVLLAASAVAQSRRLAPADILRVATIGDAQISPSGEWVVYSVATNEGNQTVTNLWLARVGEQNASNPPTSRQPEQRRNWDGPRTLARLLLPSGWNGGSPRWSPDSRSIAFISTHDGQRGIWVTSPSHQMPRLVAAVRETNFFITYAGQTFAWSPDSRMIAFISASEEAGDKSEDPQVIDRIQYKSRTISGRPAAHARLDYGCGRAATATTYLGFVLRSRVELQPPRRRNRFSLESRIGSRRPQQLGYFCG